MVFNENFQQYFSYIVAVSFIGGRNQSTRRKPPTCHKSLTNIITATTAPDILRLPDTKGHVRYDQHFVYVNF